MKERPILFSTEMIKAILETRKTMTRRVKGLELVNQRINETWRIGKTNIAGHTWWEAAVDNTYSHRMDCPYGQIGDRLWVRETWVELENPRHLHNPSLPRDALIEKAVQVDRKWVAVRNGAAYKADCASEDSNRCRLELGYQYCPSIFMPRWASRITLEITNIRIERLQEISEDDAAEEGMGEIEKEYWKDTKTLPIFFLPVFKWYWDKLNSKRSYSWKSNPWVWVIEFKKQEASNDK